MATATNQTIHLVTTAGRPWSISVYESGGQTAGAYLRLDQNQVAVATSPENTFIGENSYITDMACVATSGVIEIISNGRKTGILLDQASHLNTSAGRPALKIPLAKGTELRIQALNTLSGA